MKTHLLLLLSILSSTFSYSQVSQVKDMNPGAASSNASPAIAANGDLILSTWDGNWTESVVWTYDGTNDPIELTQLNPNLIPGRYLSILNFFNGKLYFTYGNPNGGYGEGLWEYDFVNAPVKILDSDPSGPEMYYNSIVFNNKLYFTCSDPTNGMELWSLDASNGPALSYDINPTGDSGPGGFTLFQSKLYFYGSDATSTYLYEFDGTNAPVAITNNLNWLDNIPFPIVNNKLYFNKRVNQMTFSESLHEFDGTNVNLINIPNIGDGLDYRCAYINASHFGKLYFTVLENATGAFKYWEYDFINPPGVCTYPLHQAKTLNNEAYFYYNGDSAGKELWKFNGTTATRLTDLNPNGDMYYVSHPFAYQNKMYFGASDEVTGSELWVYDPNFVGLNENSLNSVSVHPNPVSSTINVTIDGNLESACIFDLRGNLIETFTLTTFSLEHLTSGMYIIVVQSDKGIAQTKFIKD